MILSAVSAATFDGSGIDGWLFSDFTNLARTTRWLNGPLAFWTDAGLLVFGVLLLTGLWVAHRRGREALIVAAAAPVAVGVAMAVAEVIKPLVAELRPCYSMPRAYYVDACPSRNDYAFPSAHSAMAFGVVAALWLVDRRLSMIAAGFAVLEGFTRIYLGDHYPHDVLGAIVIAMPIAYLVSWLVARRFRVAGAGARPGAGPGRAPLDRRLSG